MALVIRSPRKRFKIGLLAFLFLILVPVVLAIVTVRLDLPRSAAGMAAKAVCSAAFVAGRPVAGLMAADVVPASLLFEPVRVSVDEDAHTVRADFLGFFPRRASLVADRGCVLDADPDPAARPFHTVVAHDERWPGGDEPVPEYQWGPDVDAAALKKVAAEVFRGAGDPADANARGLAIVYRGRLLMLREAPGFAATPLHGWSMTKTVSGMLLYKIAAETGLALDTPVVDAFLPGRAPAWVEEWRRDERSRIRVSDLLYMRDGLAVDESYAPWSAVPRMLWGAGDMAAWAAAHPAEVPPATRWKYLSATANIMSAVARGRFESDREYWKFPSRALFGPIGAGSAMIETDMAGNWVSSSYMWATTADWARLGLLMMHDGRWDDQEVLPPGWLKLASTPSMANGEGRGYGATTWLFGRRDAGLDCRDVPGIPQDTVAMGGHWGQIVAMVPSRDIVIVRMGWTFDGDKFDDCRLVADILAAVGR